MKIFFCSGLLLLCLSCNSGNIKNNNTSSIQQNTETTSALEVQSESELVIRNRFWLERAKRNPYDPISRIKAGTTLLLLARETGNHALYPEAESILRESLAIGPGSYEALVMLAFALSGQHRFLEAIDIAKQAIDINPYKETAWAAWGDAEFERGNLVEAKQAYTKVLQFDLSLFALTRWANLAISEGDIPGALASLAEAVKIGGNRSVANTEIARCFIQMGEIHFQQGQYKLTENYYQKALALWPDGYLPLEHMAELLATKNELTASLEIYSKVIKLAPHPDLLESYAGVLEKQGRIAESKQFYQQAFDKYLSASESGDPSYYRHLALFLTDQQQKPELALSWAKKDLLIRPVPHSYITLAWVLYQMKSYKLAKQTMDKALPNENSLNAIWLYRAGVIYQQDCCKNLSRRLLQRALSLNPNHPEKEHINQLLLQN